MNLPKPARPSLSPGPISELEEAGLRRLAKDDDYNELIVAGQKSAAVMRLRQAVDEARKPANLRCNATVAELLREYDLINTQATHVEKTLADLDRARQKKEAEAKGDLNPPLKTS